jgi:hypothetical protein
MQTFPGFFVTSMFASKYNYIIHNYSLPEEQKEQSIFDTVQLTRKERMAPFLLKRSLPINGWNVYKWNEEFRRQGISKDDKRFRIVRCWSETKWTTKCGTYPKNVIIPAEVTDDQLNK